MYRISANIFTAEHNCFSSGKYLLTVYQMSCSHGVRLSGVAVGGCTGEMRADEVGAEHGLILFIVCPNK